MNKLVISDFPDTYYEGKKVFVRIDFNVPNIEVDPDPPRIRRAIPTIDYLTSRKAKVILASHLGRPKAKRDPNFSLRPVATRLAEVLKTNIRFVEDCIGDKPDQAIKKMNDGDVILLENLRFYEGEEACDENFSAALASLADIYVNDAFGTSHRKHASTYGMARHFEHRLAGFLVQGELEHLTRIREGLERPFVVIVGGVKIKDKLGALRHLIDKADKVLVGGCVAYTFLASKGISVGDSLVEQESISWAAEVLSQHGHKILLPHDHVVSTNSDDIGGIRLISGEIPKFLKGFDIGMDTSKKYTMEIASGNQTILWNGPMGLFEKEQFSHGTMDMARSIALAYHRGCTTIVGGGDSIAALRSAGVSEREVSHISTGGSASLEYIGGKDLPGISILSDKSVMEASFTEP